MHTSMRVICIAAGGRHETQQCNGREEKDHSQVNTDVNHEGFK